MVFSNDGEISQVVVAVIIECVGMTHRAVVHIARLHFLHLVVVLEMPHSTKDVDDFRVHLMFVVPDVRTRSQAAHHDFVFLVNEVSCVQFTISSLEVLYSLLFDVVVIDDHSICRTVVRFRAPCLSSPRLECKLTQKNGKIELDGHFFLTTA